MINIGMQFFGGKGASGKSSNYRGVGAAQIAKHQSNRVTDDDKVSQIHTQGYSKRTNLRTGETKVISYGLNDYGKVKTKNLENLTKEVIASPVGTKLKLGANTYELRAGKQGSKEKFWYNITTGNGRFSNSPSKVRDKLTSDARRVHGKEARKSAFSKKKTKSRSKKK